MKKRINQLLEDEYKTLSLFSYLLLLLWTISPIVEYFLKNNLRRLYTDYFVHILYIVGILGLLAYLVYLYYLKKDKKLKVKFFIPEMILLILWIISFLSSLLSINPHLSFLGESYRKEGLLVYSMYIGFILLSSLLNNEKQILNLLKSIILSSLIITILPFMHNNFTYIQYENVFHQFNHYGYYLMITLVITTFMILEHNKIIKKIFYLILTIYFTYLLIRNNTFGCFIAVSLTYLFLLLYSILKKYHLKEVIGIIIIFIITTFTVSFYDIKVGERLYPDKKQNIVSNNFSTFIQDIDGIINKDEKRTRNAGTGRGKLWQIAWKYTKEHPIIGGGMESLKQYYIDNNMIRADRPHNSLLQISSFIGIPGAIIYLILISYIGISSMKYMKKDTIYIMITSVSLCYFISSLFGNSMYYTSPYFMIFLGLLIGFLRQKIIEQ